MRISMGVEV